MFVTEEGGCVGREARHKLASLPGEHKASTFSSFIDGEMLIT